MTPALRVSLENCGKTQEVVLSVGQKGTLGRASKSKVIADNTSVSSSHMELSVATRNGRPVLLGLDKSQNGTGLVGPLDASGDGSRLPDPADVQKMSKTEPVELLDGCRLIIPLMRKGGSGKVEVDGSNLWVLRVLGTDGGPAPVVASEREALPGPTALPVAGAARHQNGAARSAPSGPTFAESLQRARPATAAAPAPLQQPRAEPRAKVMGPKSAPLTPAEAAKLPDAYNPKTGAGRWRYEYKIGEGGLGVVYRAMDCTGSLGEVAVKTLKYHDKVGWGKQYAFAMHRESQWSMQRIHNQADPRYRADHAALFARYLEDHTGFVERGPEEFDAKRRVYEAPNFDWEKEVAALEFKPYVVMQFVGGEPLYAGIDRGFVRQLRPPKPEDPPPLSTLEKRSILVQAARALLYIAGFGLIHRDFRGCNMHLEERAPDSGRCALRVLDLGVMISSEDGQEWNTNQAVQAFRRRGETEEKRKRYDWLPWEVRAGADGSGPARNFSSPAHSFDVFSLGVLVLHLLLGRTEGRNALETIRLHPTENKMPDTAVLGVSPDLLRRMLGDAHQRPDPIEILQALGEVVPSAPLAAPEPPAQAAGAPRPERAQRSRSRRNSARAKYTGAETPVPRLPTPSPSPDRRGRTSPALAGRGGQAVPLRGSRSRSRERRPAPAAGKLARALASLVAAASHKQDSSCGAGLEHLLARHAGGLSECWRLTIPLRPEDIDALDAGEDS